MAKQRPPSKLGGLCLLLNERLVSDFHPGNVRRWDRRDGHHRGLYQVRLALVHLGRLHAPRQNRPGLEVFQTQAVEPSGWRLQIRSYVTG